MREIKFRAWDKENGEMIYSDNVGGDYYFVITDKSVLCVMDVSYDDSFGLPTTSLSEIDEVMQYTGLKDGTKWEQLTEQERFDFYNKNKSEDGASIKFQNVDDVKHLWKGKEIYEGDILKLSFFMTNEKGIVKFGQNRPSDMSREYECGNQGFYIDVTNDKHSSWRKDIWFYHSNCVVIGNIYENPELLEAANV